MHGKAINVFPGRVGEAFWATIIFVSKTI